jgi:uncharacterized heparinase superfamily protein
VTGLLPATVDQASSCRFSAAMSSVVIGAGAQIGLFCG